MQTSLESNHLAHWKGWREEDSQSAPIQPTHVISVAKNNLIKQLSDANPERESWLGSNPSSLGVHASTPFAKVGTIPEPGGMAWARDQRQFNEFEYQSWRHVPHHLMIPAQGPVHEWQTPSLPDIIQDHHLEDLLNNVDFDRSHGMFGGNLGGSGETFRAFDHSQNMSPIGTPVFHLGQDESGAAWTQSTLSPQALETNINHAHALPLPPAFSNPNHRLEELTPPTQFRHTFSQGNVNNLDRHEQFEHTNSPESSGYLDYLHSHKTLDWNSESNSCGNCASLNRRIIIR